MEITIQINKLYNLDFDTLSEDLIDSGGFVIPTLEASLWCLLNTDSYEKIKIQGVKKMEGNINISESESIKRLY